MGYFFQIVSVGGLSGIVEVAFPIAKIDSLRPSLSRVSGDFFKILFILFNKYGFLVKPIILLLERLG